MAPVFGVIKDLQPGRGKIGLQLRLVRCYNVPEFKNKNEVFSLECIFHDKQGERIHASINRSVISKFQSLLDEKKVYAVYDFVIGHNNMKTKTTNCKYRLLFFKQTKMCEVFDDAFPSHIFNFNTFTEVASMENTYDCVMFDVIGVIISTSKLQVKEINGKQTKLVDFVLEDNEHNTLACTLWDQFAEEFTDKLTDNGLISPVVMIIQFCRANTYRGENRIANSYFATRLIFDDTIEEVIDFKNGFAPNISRPITTMTQSRGMNNSEDFIPGQTVTKTISQLYDDEESGTFWVSATIFCIETIGAWAYLACNVCLKKLKPDCQRFYCEKCETYNISGRMRYKLTVRVVDDTGTAPFLLWDRECLLMIGKAAAELTSDGESHDLPVEIESLSDRAALFKVEVKPEQKRNYTGAFTVLKVNCCEDVIAKLCGTKSDDEDAKPTSKLDDMLPTISSINHEKKAPIQRSLLDEFSATVAKKRGASDKDEPLQKSLVEEISAPVCKKRGRQPMKKEMT